MNTTRLGWGEFEGEDRASARVDGQIRFLAVVQQAVPAVLTELAGEPLTLFRALFCDADSSDVLDDPDFLERPTWWWPTFDAIAAMPTTAPAFAPLRDRLLEWARDWHLEADWCLSTALRTLASWCVEPPIDNGPLDWHYGYGQLVIGEELVPAEVVPFVFIHPGWELAIKPRAEAAAELRAAFEARFREYFTELERLATQGGAIPTREQRRPIHFVWAVAFQVLGLKYGAVGKMNDVERETARDAIFRVLDLIDLPRREAPPGRPPKSPKPS